MFYLIWKYQNKVWSSLRIEIYSEFWALFHSKITPESILLLINQIKWFLQSSGFYGIFTIWVSHASADAEWREMFWLMLPLLCCWFKVAEERKKMQISIIAQSLHAISWSQGLLIWQVYTLCDLYTIYPVYNCWRFCG